LVRAVGALLAGGTLTLTHLGRHLPGRLHTKHKIKCIDRLLGNRHLHDERMSVYEELARWLIGSIERPVIIVDWSDCEPGHQWLMLKAALAVRGRAVSLYEEVHPLSRYNSPRTHRRFLRRLREVLPDGCRPIIVSDAGFRGPWFREVESYGWDWVGRVRNRIKVRTGKTRTWRWSTSLYRHATRRVRYLGESQLSHRHPYSGGLYLVKLSRRGPGRPLKRHGRGVTAVRCRKLYKDPWLLATSLPHARGMEQRVMALYAKRMQIEETFRDLKDDRWSFGLVYARSRSVARRQMLLLIATLATLVLWMVGLAAKAKGWARHFQANTEGERDVLSVVFLGREVLRSEHLTLKHQELLGAFDRLTDIIRIQAFAP
jgi:hypothetical protein